MNFANGYLYNQDSSEDIVQEVFIYIWENANALNVKSTLRGYMFAMVRNRCLNFLRSIKITDSYEYLDLKNELIAEYAIESNIDNEKEIVHEHLYATINSLPDKMQHIVKLKFFHEYKYSEIATELGISINTVKTQLKRAKRRIMDSVVSLLLFLFIL